MRRLLRGRVADHFKKPPSLTVRGWRGMLKAARGSKTEAAYAENLEVCAIGPNENCPLLTSGLQFLIVGALTVIANINGNGHMKFRGLRRMIRLTLAAALTLPALT